MSSEKRRRRRDDNGEPREGIAIAAEALVPQMGSDKTYLTKGRIDARKFAVLTPGVQAALGHFNYRAKVDEIRYYDHLVDWELTSTPSIEGRARTQVIQTLQAASGGGKAIEVAEKPGWFGRHVTDRRWKEKAVKEGKVVVE